ncbi:resA [Symbiodinium necroappetens]|uniref:ResA protein n=1 Tax=Symbiodinium necroappetens TaxID=1628268 RepID=A0A812LD14_9DINO|nr:resA [Symbiodinium necroappetens]
MTATAVAGPDHDKATVGHKAPDFTLTDFSGNTHTLSDYIEDEKVVVLEWFNPTCPYVKLHHEKQSTMADLSAKYGKENIVWLAINSSNTENPGYTQCADFIEEWNLAYPVLDDSDGKVGKMYGARTTPHMFIIDAEGVLVYNGAIDNDSRGNKSGNDKVNYVANALDELIAGNAISMAETKPYGCSVKYAR